MFIICTIFFCSAFTGFVQKVDPSRPGIRGNPDPGAGIVIRFNSTPEMILAESSNSIRFSSMLYFDEKTIRYLSIPLSDQRPQRFTLVDDQLGFQANETYYFSASFDQKTKIWKEINFTPFLPAYYKSEAELKPYLDEWVKRLDEAGWEQHQRSGWISFKLPTSESKRSAQTYQIWTKDTHRITLFVERDTYLKPEKDKYNLRIYLSNNASIKNSN